MRTISQACTGGYVAGRSAAYENQALVLLLLLCFFFCFCFFLLVVQEGMQLIYINAQIFILVQKHVLIFLSS